MSARQAFVSVSVRDDALAEFGLLRICESRVLRAFLVLFDFGAGCFRDFGARGFRDFGFVAGKFASSSASGCLVLSGRACRRADDRVVIFRLIAVGKCLMSACHFSRK